MKHRILFPALILGSLALALAFAFHGSADVIPGSRGPAQNGGFDRTIADNNEKLINDGRQIFRFDTFGDEAFWGDTLRLHQAIEGAALGGIGPGVSPATALAVGLKVDVEALPEFYFSKIESGTEVLVA